jgi:hypothetical protein
MHLGVGEMGVRAESAKPIIVKDAEGKITEALFADPRQLAVFNETMNRRYPDQRWEPVEKIVRTDLRGLKLELRLGWAVQQLALKMAVASASLLPNVTASDLQGAANTLHEPACEYHPRVSVICLATRAAWPARRCVIPSTSSEATDAFRPSLNYLAPSDTSYISQICHLQRKIRRSSFTSIPFAPGRSSSLWHL